MFDKWNLWDLYNCEPIFEFQCPRQWEQLHETSDPGVRFCDTCQKTVFFCNSPAEFVRQGELGRCIAISPALTIKREMVQDNNDDSFPMMLGMVDITPEIKEKQARMAFWEEVLRLNPDLPNEAATLNQAELQIEQHQQDEVERTKEMANFVAEQIAWQAAEDVRQERQVRVRAELERIAAMSNQEAWDKVGTCPQCGFSHRWDGFHCSHCGHPHRLPD